MIGKLFSEKNLRSNIVAGVECIYEAPDIVRFKYILLKKEKTKVLTVSSGEANSMNELFKAIPPSIPLCLAVSGRILIYRKITTSEGEDNNAVLHKILPNANINDFYIQRNETSS